MTHRSYGQFCAAARALGVLGERWALLVVRELLLGPRRFTDLWRSSINDAAVPRRGFLNTGRAFRAVAAVGF